MNLKRRPLRRGRLIFKNWAKDTRPWGWTVRTGSSSLQKNRGGATLVEPLVVVSEHLAEWVRPAIELSELGRLRQQGLTVQELMEHFGVCKTTIKERLRQIRKYPVKLPQECGRHRRRR